MFIANRKPKGHWTEISFIVKFNSATDKFSFFVNWTKRDIKYVWGGGGGGLSEENVRTERVRMERC